MAAADEKVRLTAQHIVRTLATTKNAADDMIRILSGFDDRFSDLFPSSGRTASGDAAGDDRPATSGEENPAIGRDLTQEGPASPSRRDQQSNPVTEPEVNDQEEVSGEISEEDSVKLQMAEKLVIFWIHPCRFCTCYIRLSEVSSFSINCRSVRCYLEYAPEFLISYFLGH